MNVLNSLTGTRNFAAARPSLAPSAPSTQGFVDDVKDFYRKYQTPIHVAGGALLGAGVARLCGVDPNTIMSAAGTGAFGGFMCGSPKSAICTGGGFVLGCTIGALAGLPGPAILGAGSTGGFLGWLLS